MKTGRSIQSTNTLYQSTIVVNLSNLTYQKCNRWPLYDAKFKRNGAILTFSQGQQQQVKNGKFKYFRLFL